MMKNLFSLFLLVVLSTTGCDAIKGLRNKPEEENALASVFLKELSAITRQKVPQHDKRRQLHKLMKKYPRRELLFFDVFGDLGDGLLGDLDLAGIIELITEIAGLLGDDADGGGGGGKNGGGKFGDDSIANVPEGSTVEAVTVTTYTITSPEGVQTTFSETQSSEQQTASQTMFVTQGGNGAKGFGAGKKGGNRKRHFL